jgi:mercuric ion binding protein
MHRKAANDQAKAGLVKGTIRVAGNCEMCQARIEKAALEHQGVYNAHWDKKTKILTIGYDDSATTTEAIEKVIAIAGHDTEHQRATEDTYNNLPACCHYERIAAVPN